MPCLILLTLCGWLVLSPTSAKKMPPPAIESAPPQKNAEMFSPLPKRKVFAPAAVVESSVHETVATELCTADEIRSALNASDADTRAAARRAAVQSGDHSLVDALQLAAENVVDAREKTALLDAAEFLDQPTLTEVLAGS